ncbi:hypothetical protein HQ563_15950 [bacterium]|nr:hypothetical protein [bacterium]
MRDFKSLVQFSVIVGIVFFISGSGLGQNAVPILINYQGELRDPATGMLAADGTYEMLFRIYDVEFGGTPLWEGTHSSLNGNPVEVTNGIFNVVLGSGTGNALSASIFNGSDRWLEIRVGMETLEPRQRMTSVVYSIVSENSRLLGGKEASEFAEAVHTHGFAGLTGTATDAQVPDNITITYAASAGDAETVDGMEGADLEESAEIDVDIVAHSTVADAHHAKTTSFTDLTDTATDAQIPDNITITYAASAGDAETVDGLEGADLEESAEIDADIVAHSTVADAHHAKYTNSEAVAAMGTKSDTNPLNHDKTTSLPWGSITSIPAGFADDVDDDTTYSAGGGLNLAGTVFSASFGGTGSASTVSRTDHDHDSNYVNEGQVNSVTSGMIVDLSVGTAELTNTAVTSEKIASSAIRDSHVAGSAAIAGTKINPDFGSRDVVTTGNVGVGTTSPTSKLQVSGGTVSVFNDDGVTAGDHELARFERSELTGYPGIRIGYRADGTGVTGAYVREGGVGGDLEFGTGGYPQAMIVKNDGKVGVGTTSPDVKFQVVTDAGQNSVKLNQGDVVTDNASGSTSRYVVSIGDTWYWGIGKTSTGNNNFHIINYPSSRWDLTIRNDTGNVGIGTTSPQAKLDVNGDANVAGNLTVNGVSMGKIFLTGDGTILATDLGRRELYWDRTNGDIEITNTSGDWCDYWWQAQKGATTSGGSGAIPTVSNVVIISGFGLGSPNDYGCEVHFGHADGTAGWCSVWLQYANGNLVGHYIKY